MKKLPRDVSGRELAKLLSRYEYKEVRQSGSHIMLESRYKGWKHTITIPDHKELRIGTLNTILRKVSGYLGITKEELIRELFGD